MRWRAQDLFATYGNVVHCKIVVNKSDGQSMGYGAAAAGACVRALCDMMCVRARRRVCEVCDG